MSRVLLVGGDEVLRDLFARMLRTAGHQVHTEQSALQAVARLANAEPRYELLLVCSIFLEPINLHAFMKCIEPLVEGQTQVILATAAPRDVSVTELPPRAARFYGVLQKPFEIQDLLRLAQRAVLHLRIRKARKRAVDPRDPTVGAVRPDRAVVDRNELQSEIALGLLDILESRAQGYLGHAIRVERHAVRLGVAIGLDEPSLGVVRCGALLHDVGKAILPDDILAVEEPERAEDRDRLRQHGVDGADLLRDISLLRGCVDLVHHHHERFDGSGYPQRLRGKDIPTGARVCAVADTFDHACDGWRGRTPRGDRYGIEVIEREAGAALDPELVRAFREIVKRDRGEQGT